MSVKELIRSAEKCVTSERPTFEGLDLSNAERDQLAQLLTPCNGFFAFYSALHVFPAARSVKAMSLVSWNAISLWRELYGEAGANCLFFAEDLVGGQYCLRDELIYKFDPETGTTMEIARSIEEWADVILRQANVHTLWPLAKEWHDAHGPLSPQMRLLPKLPFVLGGDFAIANLHAVERTAAMRFYADLSKQLKGVPDGTSVRLQIGE